jgi:hypothetical protein
MDLRRFGMNTSDTARNCNFSIFMQEVFMSMSGTFFIEIEHPSPGNRCKLFPCGCRVGEIIPIALGAGSDRSRQQWPGFGDCLGVA